MPYKSYPEQRLAVNILSECKLKDGFAPYTDDWLFSHSSNHSVLSTAVSLRVISSVYIFSQWNSTHK